MSLKKNAGTLLIIDDEPDLREALSTYLSRLGANVVTADTAAGALERIRRGDIDAVLSDINMPGMSGVALLREVRKLGIDVPFVFITAYMERDYMLEALRWGAMDFIEKPFGAPVVAEVMGRALELGKALRSASEVLDLAFSDTNLPPEEIVKVKQAKRAAMMIRPESWSGGRKSE